MDKLRNFNQLLEYNIENILLIISTNLGLQNKKLSLRDYFIKVTEYQIISAIISIIYDVDMYIVIQGNIRLNDVEIISTADINIYFNNNLYMQYPNGLKLNYNVDTNSLKYSVNNMFINHPKFY